MAAVAMVTKVQKMLNSLDSNFFGLSRSTRGGCCSYQASSISVWRKPMIIFVLFNFFFSIFAISMATADVFCMYFHISNEYYLFLTTTGDEDFTSSCV
jgi:hypothetical protein